MAKDKDDHAGSGLDKSDPKSLLEKAKDGLKSILPQAGEAGAKASDTLQNGTEANLQK